MDDGSVHRNASGAALFRLAFSRLDARDGQGILASHYRQETPMIDVRRSYLRGGEIFMASSTGASGEPGAQLEAAVAECRAALAREGLSHLDVALSRLWMSDRDSAAKLNDVRDWLLRGEGRSASSSFFSRQRTGAGHVAVEFYAVRPLAGAPPRRLVDFDPPRRYAHYLVSGDWLFLSGMAEEGETMNIQFDLAFAPVQAALDAERFGWADVCSASLFLQRGKATPDWMLDRFAKAAPITPPIVTFELVDELANTPKHLEIEIIARRP
jgi:enamine deaminase RidA (YjgF/YER057c/UK114 family)